MPAAAVIPAPVAYANIAAVKKLVVDGRVGAPRCAGGGGPRVGGAPPLPRLFPPPSRGRRGPPAGPPVRPARRMRNRFHPCAGWGVRVWLRGGCSGTSPPARPPPRALPSWAAPACKRAPSPPGRVSSPGCVRGRHREQNSMSKVADAPASMAERGMTRDRPRGPRSASSTGVSDPSWAMRGDPARAGGLPPRQDAARDRRHRTGTRRARGAVRTVPREVEFLDRCKTNWGESARHACLRQSRTRVWGSKMIRYRRSPYPKRCQQGPGGVHPIVARPAGAAPPATRNPKPLGSGGSTVARLKLKGVDGTTPQGVEYAA